MTVLPDVQAARKVAEAAMVDVCVVYRDSEGSADDTLNVTTGSLAPPAGDQDEVYRGCCLLRTENIQARSEGEGGAILARKLQGARVPVTADVAPGDVLVVLAARHDPQLVDRRGVVIDAEVRTFAVTRKLTLEDQVGAVVR